MANQNISLIHTLAIVFAAGIVLVGIIAALDRPSSDDLRTLSVSGEAQQTLAPDEAIISFSVITEHEDANTAREENAARAEAVVSALKAYGDVETRNFFVSPVYQSYLRDEPRDPRIQLYRVTNTVTVTIDDLDRVGVAIDAGSAAGANQVQNVQFTITDETRNAVRTELLADASQNARAKADSLAKGLDVRIRGVQSVSESNIYFPTTYARMESAAMDGAAPTTPIEPQEIDVRASVSVNFEIR